MRRGVNPTLIGSFVVLALGLLIGSVVFLGGTKALEEKNYYVLYFDSSVSGLDVGAPVTFQGVTIGHVTHLNVIVDKKHADIRVPVFIEINPNMVTEVNAGEGEADELVDRLMQRGLRAQLKTRSILTGQLEIEFDFHPKSKALLMRDESGYKQMPTIPSTENVLAELIADAQETMQTVTKLIGSKEVNDVFLNLNDTMEDSQKLMKNVDKHIQPVASRVEDGFDELTNTLRAIHALADYLARHPEALIRGKGDPGGH